MSACRSARKRVTVAYLGPAGTFSEERPVPAVRRRRRQLQCVSSRSVRATEAGHRRFRRGPVENSSEGAINRTLILMIGTNHIVSGEEFAPGPPQP